MAFAVMIEIAFWIFVIVLFILVLSTIWSLFTFLIKLLFGIEDGPKRQEVIRQQLVYVTPTVPPAIPSPRGDSWVDYAKANPAVTLNMVEKFKVEDGQFEAEKHMKMSGPTSGMIPFSERPHASFSVDPNGARKQRKEREKEYWKQVAARQAAQPKLPTVKKDQEYWDQVAANQQEVPGYPAPPKRLS